MNSWSIAAVIISVMSIILAGYSAYKTTFSPFHLRVSIGHPLMVKSLDVKGELYSLTPIIPIEFVNTGANTGEVRDIVIVVSLGSLRWLLQAESYCKEFGINAMNEAHREAVHPLVMNGKERLFKCILFNPCHQPEHWTIPMMKPNEPLPEGTWVFEFYINAGDNNCLRLISTKKYDMPKEKVMDLAKDKSDVYFPFDDSLVEARKSFEQTLSKKHTN